MTNKEIKKAVERIAQIKMWKNEEFELRSKIVDEFRVRGKDKINLGGPTKEDYVKLNSYEVDDYFIGDLYRAFMQLGYSKGQAHKTLFKMATISKGKVKDHFGKDWLSANLPRISYKQVNQISYRLSSDAQNMVRGIDL